MDAAYKHFSKTVLFLATALLLVVPGRGFGMPGYFRIAYCVDTPVIERSLPGFERVMRKMRG